MPRSLVSWMFLGLLAPMLIGCSPDGDTPAAEAATLGAGASTEEVAQFLVENRHRASASPALLLARPTLSREEAYEIQMATLAVREAAGDSVVGWKLGGTRVTAAAPNPDPSFAYLLAADRYAPGATLDSGRFVAGEVQVEAEIGFVMGKDLPGPEVSMEALRAAVSQVTGAIELISIRMRAGEGEAPPAINYMIADALSNAGVIVGGTPAPVDALDLAKEKARAEVNGEIMSSGAGAQIMGSTPWDALLWLANELPKHGRMLRAGEVVVTGSLIDNPTAGPGDRAEVVFEHLGRIDFSLGMP